MPARHLGVSADHLRRCTPVRQLIAAQKPLSQAAWLQTTRERAAAVLVQVEQQGDFLSQNELAHQLGVARDVFQRYPELQTLWQMFAQHQYQRHEAALLARVEAAIATCKAQPLPLTLRRVASLVMFPRTALKCYPRILAVLSAHGLVRVNPASLSVVE